MTSENQDPLMYGLLSALFVIFSVYFVVRRKILPVILAHMYFDFLALLSSAQY